MAHAQAATDQTFTDYVNLTFRLQQYNDKIIEQELAVET